MKNEKERHWTFIVYPESVVSDWLDLLQQTGCQCLVSPLHDKDLNSDNTLKKPHFHILICFPGPTTYNRVLKICEGIGATIPKRVCSPVGMVRYFTHKDNPEKAQYDERDLKSLNGFDVSNFDGLTLSMEMELKKSICVMIKEKNIKSLSKLVYFFIENDLQDLFYIVSKNTLFFNYLLQSIRTDDIIN